MRLKKIAECYCENNGVTLLYACSGAANTGYLADRVSRKIMVECCGKMTCLATNGAELSGFIESVKGTEKNILIDDCSIACGKKIFEEYGLACRHYIITGYGVEKGKTDINRSVINDVTSKLKEKIFNG
jgi:uncharacterized metal-binding protein